MTIGPVTLLLCLASTEAREAESLLTLYDFSETGTTGHWRTINDDVMGGISRGEFRVDVASKRLEFFGDLSLENRGGFASVRSSRRTHDLSKFDGLILRVRGDGRRYSVNVRTNQTLYGGSYRAVIRSRKGEWITVRVPFASLSANFRGRTIPNAQPINRSQVRSVGVTLSDKRAGPFRLEIDWIKAFKASAQEADGKRNDQESSAPPNSEGNGTR